MRRVLLFIIIYGVGIGFANAAGRDGTIIARTASTTNTAPITARTATNVAPRSRQTSVRDTTTVVSGGHTARTTTQRATAPITTARTTTISTPRQGATIIHRTKTSATKSDGGRNTTARAATFAPETSQTETFGTGYITCRDAYFTCMDQFCAKQNENYRRCTCSARIDEIKSRESALAQAADSLQTFSDFNLDAITKTGAEVTAMGSATAGESAIKKDTSDAAKQLSGISDILSKTKKKSMSTLGTLDIAGDISAIWATTDLTSGANIANLTGEALYNAVHAQCSEIMTKYCPNAATQTMVISAYGMYIENDCSALINALDKQLGAAKTSIHNAEREMQLARLENYNNHNSESINDCVANVRADITADTACGRDYVHCLDVSGRYLNRTNGEPIYTTDFYKLNEQISLSGDILNNQSNRMIVAELERFRKYAQGSLNSCTALADDVWDEFMRQAIREIYQHQQTKIRTVQENCLDVVNTCYDEQNQSLKDFTNVKDQLLIGSRFELSEEMCREKLNACSNLYGDINLLVSAMHNIVSQEIAKECRSTLQSFIKERCAVTGKDTLHTYPYGCRTYTPGSQRYASNPQCNSTLPENPIEVCGDYIGSLYQVVARYALNACMRPSETDNFELSAVVLQDVSAVMDQVRQDMAKSLATECARLGGIWLSVKPNIDNLDEVKHQKFYEDTAANMEWGFCAYYDETKECFESDGLWNGTKCICTGNKVTTADGQKCRDKTEEELAAEQKAQNCQDSGGKYKNNQCTCSENKGLEQDGDVCKCKTTGEAYYRDVDMCIEYGEICGYTGGSWSSSNRVCGCNLPNLTNATFFKCKLKE